MRNREVKEEQREQIWVEWDSCFHKFLLGPCLYNTNVHDSLQKRAWGKLPCPNFSSGVNSRRRRRKGREWQE